MAASWLVPRRTALVLGGGGLKGFAHIGVMRALEERGILPVRYAGTSIGALIGAARVAGVSLDEMEQRAIACSKRDLFRLNRVGMLMERSRTSSLYLEQPLRELVNAVTPDVSFRELGSRLLVNTVDLDRGTIVVWGLPGLENVNARDAVYASCALPGFFPPACVGARVCVDGGTIDNLPTAIASLGIDAVIAVDVGNTDLGRAQDVRTRGFAAIYMRAASVMMHALQLNPLATWTGPPMLLIRPRVGHRDWFEFSHAQEMIQAGYDGTMSALDELEGGPPLARNLIYPRRQDPALREPAEVHRVRSVRGARAKDHENGLARKSVRVEDGARMVAGRWRIRGALSNRSHYRGVSGDAQSHETPGGAGYGRSIASAASASRTYPSTAASSSARDTCSCAVCAT
jgi:Predicted esterase of the alpha-beta hydrolase superfamily